MTSHTSASFRYEVDGDVAVITLTRPQQLNPFGAQFYDDFAVAVLDAAHNPAVKATLVTAEGRFFSAGADVLDRPKSQPPLADRSAVLEFYRARFQRTIANLGDLLFNHPKVLIFALNGPAVGIAGALLAHADIIYATTKSYVHIPFGDLGLVCEGGSSFMLAERMGMAKATEMLLYSKKMYAPELKECNFVNEIVDDPNFDVAIRKLVKSNIKNANSASLLGIKKLMRQPLATRASAALINEVHALSNRFATGDPQKMFAALAVKHSKSKI